MIDSIFIVGTGRSGTHFLCRSLRGFSNVDDYMNGKENHSIRIPLTEMALKHEPLSEDILSYYEKQIKRAKAENKIFLDQLHTNLYHVDQLAERFTNALFLATDRPIEQIVASMLNHKGVRSWTQYALDNDCPFPNQFLGVDNKKDLTNLSTHLLCAKRVKAHNTFRDQIIERHPNRVRLVKFVRLVEGQQTYIQEIFTQKELKRMGQYTELEKANREVLGKFKKDLNTKMMKEINQ